MLETLSKMNRINQVRADPDAPNVPKDHKKQINIWDEGMPTPLNKPDIKNYPTDEELCIAWDSNIFWTQETCREIGMALPVDISTEKERMRYCGFSRL